jgi:hypothetical protein
MPDPTALQVLQSIDESLKKLVQLLAPKPTAGVVASDADLDSQWGDEIVKFTPRDLVNEDIKGKRMSQCSFAALTMLAGAYESFAEKNVGQMTDKGKPKSDFDLRTARRARGWAARIRSGAHVQPVAQDEPDERW